MADDGAGVVAGAARIRDTAKWLTISLATLGGILVAGSQLSDIGTLKPGTGRFVAAIIGGLVAATAAIIIMWLSILIATSRSITMARLTGEAGKAPPKGLGNLLTDQRFLNGRPGICVLNQEFMEALTQRDAVYKALESTVERVYAANLCMVKAVHELATNPKLTLPEWAGVRENVTKTAENAAEELKAAKAERSAHTLAASAADAKVTALNATVIALLQDASYRNLAHRWRRMGAVILGCGVLAAFGIGLFAWAANPPAAVKASAATPAVLTTPGRATVKLTADGREALQDALGATCPLSSPLAALKLGETDIGTDVLVQQSGCVPTRFVAVPAWADVHDEP
jgi:hypothetical protein